MAANHMRKVQGLKLSSEQRLELYALFKQATEGDCDEPKPGLIDLVGRAKWGAWDKLRGKPPVEAMEAYVVRVSDFCPNWLKETQGEAHDDDAGIQLQEELNKELVWEGNDAEEEDGRGAGLAYGVTVSTMAGVQGNLEDWGANEQIFAAASDGDISRLEEIVSSGVKVNVQDEEGRTPLHFAADRGQSAVISRLLELGALVDARDTDGMTPLACAVACENVKEIQLLGTKLNPRYSFAQMNETVLFWLIQNKFAHSSCRYSIQLLTRYCTEIYYGLCEVSCASCYAVFLMNAEKYDTPGASLDIAHDSWVKAGADINCPDNDGSSPVSIADESVRHLLLLPTELPVS